jgi:hypothetical protein
MAKPTNHQVHAAGRHLVVAEALLRGLSSRLQWTQTYVEVNGHKVQVQVAAKGAWQIDDIDKYTSATVEHIILVDITDGRREFYVCPGDKLRAAVRQRHADFVASKGGVRPRNPHSKHSAIQPEHVHKWRNTWARLSRTGE